MRLFLFSLLLIPFLSNGQSIYHLKQDTTIAGIWDLGGKILRLDGKVYGTGTITNATISAYYKKDVLDTTVTLQDCDVDEAFSTAWYGAKSANADNWKQLQTAADMCIANNIYMLKVVDDYTITKEWTFKNVHNNEYVGFSMHLKGESNIWGNKVTINYTGNFYATGWQYCKGVIIDGVKIQGNYVAPTNTGVDYYTNAFPVKGYHAGIMIDYDGSKNTGGSTGVRITDTWVDGFDVCYDISPNGVTFNADIVKLENIRVGDCRIGVRSGQAQEKGNEIINIVAWGNCHTLIQIGKSGKFQAGQYIVRGGNIAGNVVQLFDVSLAGWNSFAVDGIYAESIARIGTILASTANHQMPVNLDKMNIRFALKTQAGGQPLINGNAPRILVSNSTLWYYGTTGENMNFQGQLTFMNCDFGASNWSNPNIMHISLNNSNFNLSKNHL